MQRPAIGKQRFEDVIKGNYLYIDKTDFIREWWEYGDDVTLIARPRRFGKTLNMNMLECFFSVEYVGRGDLFEGLSIWEHEEYRLLQGTYPVIALSFADIKSSTYQEMLCEMEDLLKIVYNTHAFLLDTDVMTEEEKYDFKKDCGGMDVTAMKKALKKLSIYLSRYYKKDVIILLDEYDTPLQEAYVNGYWEKAVGFARGMFNSTFKTNPHLCRAVMTGITRISKESIFSDLNNLDVVTTTSEKYATAFGFSQGEVFDALDAYGLADCKKKVKEWYDGFTFGTVSGIYNPWSIINFIGKKKFAPYWANTSGNGLVNRLIREGTPNVKRVMQDLLDGKTYCAELDEQIVFSQLEREQNAIWSLFLAGGYLKVVSCEQKPNEKFEYRLALTNKEVRMMFERMIAGWFETDSAAYNDFIKALLSGNIEEMNAYMNDVAMESFSYFDSGSGLSESKLAERFYHGFVLGLIVELREVYHITSNRESGLGRYDVMLEPMDLKRDGIIIEFKVFHPQKENTLAEAVCAALAQIEEKNYDAELAARGIPKERIRHYGFAFEGKHVLIGTRRRENGSEREEDHSKY